MGKYRVTTDQGVYEVTTDDAPASRRMGSIEAIKGLSEGAGDVASGALKSLRHPIDALSSIWHNMQSEADRSAKSLNKGDFLKAAQHAAGIFPVLGPALDSVADAIDDKVDDRELGQRIGRALTMIVAPDVAKKALDVAKSAGGAASTVRRVVTDPAVVREGIKIVPKGAQMVKWHDAIVDAAKGPKPAIPPEPEFSPQYTPQNPQVIERPSYAAANNYDPRGGEVPPVIAQTPPESAGQVYQAPFEQTITPREAPVQYAAARNYDPRAGQVPERVALTPEKAPVAETNPALTEFAKKIGFDDFSGQPSDAQKTILELFKASHEAPKPRPFIPAPKSEPVAAQEGLDVPIEPKTELESLLERSLNGEKVAEQAKSELNDHLKLEALKKTESIIDKHQTTRALKLGRFLQDYGITPEHIDKMTPEEWNQVGSVAEVENPSATTIQKTKDLLKMGQQ